MAAHILNDFVVVNCTSPDIDPKSESIHFLTHIGRHQTSLPNIISSHIKKVYTSEFNIWYLKTFFNVNASQFISVPLWTKRKVKSKGLTFTFEFLNANHCPGSVMVLIKGDFGTYLYTGNCRYSPAMLDYTSLRPYSQGIKILDKLYVNAAYLKIEYNFPKREVVVQQIIDFISDHSEEKIYICSRLLGKEDILFRIALELNEKIFVSQDKLKVLNKLGYKSSAFTTVLCEARLRVVDVGEITWIKMKRRRLTEKCVGIIFSACPKNSEKLRNHGIYVFPASDHSSAAETKLMIKSLRAKDIYLLNNDSTLSEYIKSQQNLESNKAHDNNNSSTINSSFALNQKNEMKCRGKKKLSLRLNSKNDENRPPLIYTVSSKQDSSSSNDNILKENNILIDNNKISKNGENTYTQSRNVSLKGGRKANKNVVNSTDDQVEAVPGINENSFLLDENARTGFTSSSEQSNLRSQKSGLSPSFPPSVSNIVLTETSKLYETSFKHYQQKQSFISSNASQDCTESVVIQAPVDTSKNPNASGSSPEQQSSEELISSCTYYKMSRSYPRSVSNIIIMRPSETNAKTKDTTGEITTNLDKVSITQKVRQNSVENGRSKNLEPENISKCLREGPTLKSKVSSSSKSSSPEYETTSQINILSPSYPPSESNIVLSGLNDKTQVSLKNNENISSACSTTENFSAKISDELSRPRNLRKRLTNSTKEKECAVRFNRHRRPSNKGKSYTTSMLPSENLNKIPEVNETVLEVQKLDSSSLKKNSVSTFEPEVVSESNFTYSNIEHTESMIHARIELQNQSSCQQNVVSMDQTRIVSSDEEDAEGGLNVVNPCQNQVIVIPASLSESSNSLSKGDQEKSYCEIPSQDGPTKSNCGKSASSHYMNDSHRNKVIDNQSVFKIDNLNSSKVLADKSLELTVIPKFTSLFKSTKSVVISINNSHKLKEYAGLANEVIQGLSLTKTNSLFTADIYDKAIQNVKSTGNSSDLFRSCNSKVLLEDHNVKQAEDSSGLKQISGLSMSSGKENTKLVSTKPDEALADQTTVCYINHQVFCQVHCEDIAKDQSSPNSKSDVYEQSTVISNGQNLLVPRSTTSVNQPNRCNLQGLIECQSDQLDNLECSQFPCNVPSLSSNPPVKAVTKVAGKINKSEKIKSQTSAPEMKSSPSPASQKKFTSLPLLRSLFKNDAKQKRKVKPRSSSLSSSKPLSQNLNESFERFNSKSTNKGEVEMNSTKNPLIISKSQLVCNVSSKFSSQNGSSTSFSQNNHSQADTIKEDKSSTVPTISVENHQNILSLTKKSNVDLFSSDISICRSTCSNNLDSLNEKNKMKSSSSKSCCNSPSKVQILRNNNIQPLNPPLSLSQPNLLLTASSKYKLSSSLPSHQPPSGLSLNKKLNAFFSPSFHS